MRRDSNTPHRDSARDPVAEEDGKEPGCPPRRCAQVQSVARLDNRMDRPFDDGEQSEDEAPSPIAEQLWDAYQGSEVRREGEASAHHCSQKQQTSWPVRLFLCDVAGPKGLPVSGGKMALFCPRRASSVAAAR